MSDERARIYLDGKKLADIVRAENARYEQMNGTVEDRQIEDRQIALLQAQAAAERAELDAKTEQMRVQLEEKLVQMREVWRGGTARLPLTFRQRLRLIKRALTP